MKRYINIALMLLIAAAIGCTKHNEKRTTLTISEETVNVSYVGRTISIEVHSNVDFDYEVSHEGDGWITPLESRAKEPTKSVVRFDVAANDEYDARRATIRFVTRNGYKEQTVEVIQAQKDALILTGSELAVSYEEQVVELAVETNAEISMTTANKWIELVDSRALESGIIRLHIAQNNKVEERSGLVTFRAGSASQKVMVTQQAAPSIIRLTLKHNDTLFYTPTWQGNNPSGSVIWDDKTTTEWSEDVSYNYGDTNDHTTVFDMYDTSAFTIEQIGSIDSITIEIN